MITVAPLINRLKTPDRLVGTVAFLSSMLAVHRLDELEAVTVLLPTVHASVPAPPNGVWNAPTSLPGSNTLG